jgi:hypothetical protein
LSHHPHGRPFDLLSYNRSSAHVLHNPAPTAQQHVPLAALSSRSFFIGSNVISMVAIGGIRAKIVISKNQTKR